MSSRCRTSSPQITLIPHTHSLRPSLSQLNLAVNCTPPPPPPPPPHTHTHTHTHSSSQSPSQGTLPAPEVPLLGVMGVSDWDFLRPPGMEPSEDEESLGKRPSLDDFDGEIAVFQVSDFSFRNIISPLHSMRTNSHMHTTLIHTHTPHSHTGCPRSPEQH